MFYDISQKLYAQQAQANGANANADSNAGAGSNGEANNGNVYDTEYKVEEENPENK